VNLKKKILHKFCFFFIFFYVLWKVNPIFQKSLSKIFIGYMSIVKLLNYTGHAQTLIYKKKKLYIYKNVKMPNQQEKLETGIIYWQ